MTKTESPGTGITRGLRRTAAFFFFFLAAVFSAQLAAQQFLWETPETITAADCAFPDAASNGSVSALIWQEFEDTGDGGKIWLSARIFNGGIRKERKMFAGPYPYSGIRPAIASVSVGKDGKILIAASGGAGEISVFISDDCGETFRRSIIHGGQRTFLNPKVFSMAGGDLLLLATESRGEKFTLVCTRSQDGISWEPVAEFAPAKDLNHAFLPAHASSGGQDFLVFQALYPAEQQSTFQLYCTESTDGGQTWSRPSLLSSFERRRNFSLPGNHGNTDPFFAWNNQRPDLVCHGDKLYTVWERSRPSGGYSGIYFAEIGKTQLHFTGTPEKITRDGSCAAYPRIVFFQDRPAVTYFDTGENAGTAFLAVKNESDWITQKLSGDRENAAFVLPVRTDGSLEIYWQRNTQEQTGSAAEIVRLSHDRFTPAHMLSNPEFRPGGRVYTAGAYARIRVCGLPENTAGFSFAWGYNKAPDAPRTVMRLTDDNIIRETLTKDGTWILGVRTVDRKGVWGNTRFMEIVRDTEPPPRPYIPGPEKDAQGFLLSNSEEITWQSAGDKHAEYIWNLDYLGLCEDYSGILDPGAEDFQQKAAGIFTPGLPASNRCSPRTSLSLGNRANGLYALSVSAVDEAGNTGEPAVYFFALNKQRTETSVACLNFSAEEPAESELRITGEGFARGGKIYEIMLDRDGAAPFDFTLTAANQDFQVESDNLITGIRPANLPVSTGEYHLILCHPVRGMYSAGQTIVVQNEAGSGTPQFRIACAGEPMQSTAADAGQNRDSAQLRTYMLFLFLILLLTGGVYGFISFRFPLRHRKNLYIQAREIPDNAGENKKARKPGRKKAASLRIKFIFFTGILVLFVVILISVLLGMRFFRIQKRTLTAGLQTMANVLLESLVSGGRAYLPGKNLMEISFLPAQVASIPEAVSVTITGPAIGKNREGTDFIWASNDAGVQDKTDTEGYIPGESRLITQAAAEIARMNVDIDNRASLSLSPLSDSVAFLSAEAASLAQKTDAVSVLRSREIQTVLHILEEETASRLAEFSDAGAGSYPHFDPENPDPEIERYLFFKPILYRQNGSPSYVHGNAIVEISTAGMFTSLREEGGNIVMLTTYTAAIALFLGIFGSLVLAHIIISPIRRLAAYVSMIRDTEDKSLLEGMEISFRTRDEIGRLGETVNEMTRALANAAIAAKELTVGKETQKMFIPLETDEKGRKLTCGNLIDDGVEFFGYYEGAKGVSGDYFDYIKLDGQNYAIIKCDVAGKGVPAALIMIEVATIFQDFFQDWDSGKDAGELARLAVRINDLIESRGFHGRFAAFTLCLFNTENGDLYFCNAGDNLVHIYDASEQKMTDHRLHPASAAGAFPMRMINESGGFKVEKMHLDPGDILFLYTDGIDEAKRYFRDHAFKITMQGNENSELLGSGRVCAVLEAVLRRGTFVLTKQCDPEGDGKTYTFDFSSCSGTLEEAVIALVSVEKIFRMYKDPEATEFDRVQTDCRIDAFLEKHFTGYREYCGQKSPHREYPEYLFYENMQEDPQYDDLTILGIQKRER